MTTQICIATGQRLANLIPILHLKPKKVFLIVSAEMKSKKEDIQFQNVIKALNIKIDLSIIEDCPDTDLNKINQFLEKELKPQLPQESCVFNLTGGTKLHSFSIYEVFKNRGYEDKFVYADTINRLFEYYPVGEKKAYNEFLPTLLDAKMTLNSLGKKFISANSENTEWKTKVEQRKELTYWIAQNIQKVSGLLRVLNAIVRKLYPSKDNYLERMTDRLKYKQKGKCQELLKQAYKLGLIDWDGDLTIGFNNYSQARYLTGDWIEEYIWLVIQESDLNFEEVYCGLSFENIGFQNDDSASNEIDIFIQHANRTLAIECKSASSVIQERESQNMFHKLKGVADRAGGLTCSSLFVSAFELKQQGRDLKSLYHAKEKGIRVIQAEGIINELPKALEKWKDSGRL